MFLKTPFQSLHWFLELLGVRIHTFDGPLLLWNCRSMAISINCGGQASPQVEHAQGVKSGPRVASGLLEVQGGHTKVKKKNLLLWRKQLY